MRNVLVVALTVFGGLLTASNSGAWQNPQINQPPQIGQNPQIIQNSQADPPPRTDQSSPLSQPSQVGDHPAILDSDDTRGSNRDRLMASAARSLNTDRHKRLVADTSKLLQLSTELKSEVDKTTKDEMSVQVIQKAAEIEKLARDVKDRMKG